MLQEFIGVNRDEIIRRCRAKVSARSSPPPTRADIDHGVPVFLDQLFEALRQGTTSTVAISDSALRHGHDLLLQGFTVSQVVHAYGDVCQSITELALETDAPISIEEFRTLNRCLDDAIAGAVTEYGRERNQSTLDGEAAREQRRQGYFTHELGNLIDTGLIAFEILKAGNVGLGGSTGAVLQRSLIGLRALVGRSIAEVRLPRGPEQGTVPRRRGSSTKSSRPPLEGTPRGHAHGDSRRRGGDHPGRPAGARRGRGERAPERVQVHQTPHGRHPARRHQRRSGVLEVQDECGGLAGRERRRPVPAVRAAERQSHGARSRPHVLPAAVEANEGLISARTLPGEGCVFSIDLPRVPALAAAEGSCRALTWGADWLM